MKTMDVPIKGMHCHSCEIVLADRLSSLEMVEKAEVSLKHNTVRLYGNQLPSLEMVKKAVEEVGYELGTDKEPWLSRNPKDYENIFYGLVVAGLGALLFHYADISRFASFDTTVRAAGVMALIVGLTAGFSSCMALVGGLVLGLSAKYAAKHTEATALERFRPHLVFNVGRIVSFIVLGAAIGALGSFLSLKGSLLGLLTIAAGVVMLGLGLQLTGLFPRFNTGLSLPAKLSEKLGIKTYRSEEYSPKNALLLGALSFFLPCGFTQAMQLYAVSTGSAVTGALVMGLFALGTAPGLLGVGGLVSVMKGESAKRFFKITGVVVAAMALYNIGNGYNITGWQKPFIQQPVAQTAPVAAPLKSLYKNKTPAKTGNTSASKDQTLRTVFYVKKDIFPRNFTVSAGKKYVLEVDAKEDGAGCMSTIMIPGLVDTPQYLKGGKTNRLTFTAREAGSYTITCAMGIPRGTITVV